MINHKKLEKDDDFALFFNALHYLKIGELKKICSHMELNTIGKKELLIDRVFQVVKYGKYEKEKKIPEISYAKPHVKYDMDLDSLMLKGAYRHNAKSRIFFENLIGPHFQFSSFCIDWLNDRWYEGNPPTYREFIKMWNKEYERRRNLNIPLDPEWAYINFVQDCLKNYPNLTRDSMLNSWNVKRKEQINLIIKFLNYNSIGDIF